MHCSKRQPYSITSSAVELHGRRQKLGRRGRHTLQPPIEAARVLLSLREPGDVESNRARGLVPRRDHASYRRIIVWIEAA
jgi:hypothetical protein